MTWTLSNSGTASLTAINTTPTTLCTDTNNATFVFSCDLNAMINGDLIRVQINSIALAGGAQRLMWEGFFANAQLSPNRVSPPIASDQSLQVLITRVGGTIPITSVSTVGPTYGVAGTGQTTTATGIIQPFGPSPMPNTATSTAVLMTSAVSFNTTEVVWATTVTNSFTMNGSPAALSVPWKLLRI